MKTFREFINEMAVPTEETINKPYYHGTSAGLQPASSIAKNGIVPPEVPQKQNALTPVAGKVYITPHIHYAQIYALGGDIAGSNYKPEHEYGHVFAFSGKKLKDVQPDEDDVGGLYGENKGPSWLNRLVDKHVTQNSRNKAKDGEYEHYARIGKKILPHMSDEQKLDLIHNYGTHIAHTGTIMPDRAYRIHKDEIPLLKRDGSNFFEHAEEVNMKDLANGQHVLKRKRKPL